MSESEQDPGDGASEREPGKSDGRPTPDVGASAPTEPKNGASKKPRAPSADEAEDEAEAAPSSLAVAPAGSLAMSQALPRAEAPGDSAEDDAPEPRLLAEGNPLEVVRGPVTIAAGTLIAFTVMAIAGHFRWGVAIGMFGVLVATYGVLDLLGSFADPDERVARQTTLTALRAPLAIMGGGLVLFGAMITLAVAGLLPIVVTAIFVPASFMTAVVGLYLVGSRLGVFEEDIPLLGRHGFWLVLVGVILYLPLLGSHSLTDPWETHYGEVSREILARDDWISLWWAQDGWFWSKPVFDFWIQALAMAFFGVRYRPNEMLSAVATGRTPWPEWAVRLPIFLLTMLAVYLLYKAVAKVFGRRAGLFGGLVLLTMPQWFMVSHQTMTDMPFVATMSAAMALFLLGANEDRDRQVRAYEVDLGFASVRLSAYHAVIGAVVLCTLPQILYLFSRNVDLRLSPFGIHLHMDAFMSGSAQNCGLPGNEACHQALPLLRGLSPALQALIWVQTLGVFLFVNWGERRAQRLYYLAAWFFMALSTMAKGPAGLGLPVLCALAYVVVTNRRPAGVLGRFRLLLDMEAPSGALIVLAVAMPWFVAMYARHGQPFTDRLLFHDMFKRAFTHVHDTNEGDDVSFRFYVWQLGYATFPWVGLAPAGLLWWLRRREDSDARGDVSVFLAIWFVLGFALFSLMLTKFHHYILPVVPAAAMLIGIFLDDVLRGPAHPKPIRTSLPLAGERLGVSVLAMQAGGGTATLEAERDAALEAERAPLAEAPEVPLDDEDSPESSSEPRGGSLPSYVALVAGLTGITLWLTASGEAPVGSSLGGRLVALLKQGAVAAVLMTIATACAIALLARLLGRGQRRSTSFAARYESLQIGAVGLIGALLVALVGRDLVSGKDGMPSQIRFLHLFTYNYKRPWPASLDFSSALWFFLIVAALLTASLVVAAWRRYVVAALVALAVLFAAWGIDVYFVKTSPHWGQRETILAYYRANAEIPGPIVAYEMNWKGENFYTGNAIPAFVTSGKKFQDYILEEKKKGKKTFYFVTEHSRTGTLQNEIGLPRIFDKLTTPELNNKFVLVRATFE